MIGYHTLIGQEDWCLSCHTSGHRNPHCPISSDEGATQDEDQRHELLWAILAHYILSTGYLQPRTVCDVVKEVLIHGLVTRGHNVHVARRDCLFSAMFEQFSNQDMSSFQAVWFDSMSSSINHGIQTCAKGLVRRPLPILKGAMKARYMTQAEDLDGFVEGIFEQGSGDDSPVTEQLLVAIKESLQEIQSNYEAWMEQWDTELQAYLEDDPKIQRLKSADREWLMNAFSTLRAAQL